MVVTSTIPREGMDSLVRYMNDGLFSGKKKEAITNGAFSNERARTQGVMVVAKNAIAFDYQPGPPRKLALIYFTGVTHVIEEERSLDDRASFGAVIGYDEGNSLPT